MAIPREGPSLPSAPVIPLTAFEEYLLHDGTAASPMEFFLLLSFTGTIPLQGLEKVAETLLERHPFLASRGVTRGGGRPAFRGPDSETGPAGNRSAHIVTAESGDREQFPAPPPLDPAAGPLVRLTLRTDADRCQILAQFHHVATDGLGAVQFLDELLELLDAELVDRPPRLRSLDAGRLAHRGRYGMSAWRLIRELPRQAVGLAGVRQFLRNRPLSSADIDPPQASLPPRDHLAFHSIRFSTGETSQLREAARQMNVSLNELITAMLFATLAADHPVAERADSRDVFRICVPVNLRTAADRRTPAANVCSMVFLDRQPEVIAVPHHLLRSIHDEMAIIRSNGLGLTFIGTLLAGRWLPGGIAAAVRRQPTAASLLFTNLGRVLRGPGPRRERRVGRATLEAVEVLAPLRAGTPLAVAAVEYADSLTLTIRRSPEHVSLHRADRFSSTLTAALRRTIAAFPLDTPIEVATR
jgi:hypothetical protein